jgi:hypothetical protein
MKIFGLACLAALNPKLLAVDLLLIGNRRPRLMFACFLLGGMGLALTVGLLDVLVVHADAIQGQGSASAGLDLALGLLLLIIGTLLATGHLHGRQRPHAQARVGTEFGSDPWTAPSSYTPPANFTKVAAYSNVTLTSYSGHTATLWSWWVHHKLLANTEQQSGSDWVAVPTDLSNGGASFSTYFVPQSGQGPDQPVLH